MIPLLDKCHRHPNYQYPDKSLIIVGSGRCLWDDIEPLRHLIRSGPWHVMTVNIATCIFPYKINHGYSNHADLIEVWVKARDCKHMKNYNVTAHSGHANPRSCVGWNTPMHGTSGLNAVYVGALMGYQRIILAGIPLDDSGHVYDPPWVGTKFTREVPPRGDGKIPRYWDHAKELGMVTSMSGRTKDLLGEPDLAALSRL